MATEQQTSSESPSQKRPRRSKQDPQFIFDNPQTDAISSSSSSNINKRTPNKVKTKPSRSVDTADTSGDLYEPGDIVWCKLGGFPWWPALIFRCYAEGGIHTKTLNSNNKPKRLFFVYFYGKYLEYSWISTRWLLQYAGLSNFIQHAETAVQQAATKSEQHELANRYQLKVSMKKRVQWDEAIELADRAITMTKEERIKEFNDLLNDAMDLSKTNLRRRKISIEKNQEEDEENKQHGHDSSISLSIEGNDLTNTTKRSSGISNDNSSEIVTSDEQGAKRKRGRKPKPDANPITSTENNNNDNQRITRAKSTSPIKIETLPVKSSRKNRKSTVINENDDDEYKHPLSSINRSDQQTPSSVVHLIQPNNPPLSNYEQKQIVEGLLNHPKGDNLTFEEAESYATEKAIEIVYENHNYRMNNVSSEWFYESILLKYPSVVFKYRSWFENIKIDIIPNGNDMIKLKQWQIALMLHAQIKAEQQQQQKQNSSNEN